jgi:hypothetical protein
MTLTVLVEKGFKITGDGDVGERTARSAQQSKTLDDALPQGCYFG